MSQYPESVVINGDTYTDGEGGYIVREGHVFTEDENHSGYMWLTQEAVDKYNLKDVIDEVELSEVWTDEELKDMMDENDPPYKYALSFYHAAQWLDPNTGKLTNTFDESTPFGDLYSEEFVAWWNEFPEKLFELDEKDGVFHGGFSDG